MMYNELEHSHMDDQIEMVESLTQTEDLDRMDHDSDLGHEQEESSSLTVVKIGGSTLGSHDTTLIDLVELQAKGDRFVVVHGGGKTISEWMEKQGVRPKFVNGLRVTDSQSLDIVIAVLTGLINKSLVASINNIGGRAIGISGADGRIVNAEIADPDLGYVGRVKSINTEPIEAILEAGYMPVIAPVGVHSSSSDENMLLNINADTVAGYISSSIHSDRMVFLTDVEGVLDSSKRLISRMTKKQADSLVASHVIDGGMIPKMEACIEALAGGAVSQIIDGRVPGALKDVVSGENLGTRIG
ncbi:MAG TPA: acetylglutamate kinase [Dehalococcoidia bacterium]|nr:acetylglutamate kinase [Chloroflexota bacterium]HCE75860.1 acetylglutamate kinase [Dehalococcoidia bacterium]|tara:strand:+ start:1113 stop:2012 length:900 start_codon:yes stop_codon:yes gene_type:complete